MVDLVKIRKKAKKGRAEVGGGKSEIAPTPDPPPPTPDLPPPTSDRLERFKQEAGRRREGLVRPIEEAAAGEQLEVLTFTMGEEQYAVGIERIVEIVTPRAVARVPNADPSIVGIISLRGTIVTVIDVRGKLRHPTGDGGPDSRIIVVEGDGETLGFQVDRVLRVVRIDAAAMEPHPVVHTSEQSEAIRGVFRHANALTILLDLDKLLR